MENNIVNLRRKEAGGSASIKNSLNISEDSGKLIKAGYVDKIIEIAIYFIILFAPLFLFSFSNSIYETLKISVFLFFFGFILFVWMLNSVFFKKKIVVAKSFLTLSFLIFTIVVALSALFGVDRASSIFGSYGNPASSLIFYGSLFAFYLVVAGLVAERGSRALIYNFFKAFLASSFVVVLLTICLYLGLKCLAPLEGLISSSIQIADPMSLSVYLSVVFFVALYGYKSFVGRDVIFKAISILLSVLIFICFIFINWSLVWLLISAFLVLSFVPGLIFNKGQAKKASDIFTGALMLVSLVFVISSVDLSRITSGDLVWKGSSIAPAVNNFLHVKDLGNNSISESGFSDKVANSIAYQSLQNSPALGSGVGTYYYDFAKYKPFEFNYEKNWNIRFINSNNGFLEKVSTLGFVGMAAFLLLVLAVIAVLWKNLRFAEENKFLLVAFLILLSFQFFYVETIVSKFMFVMLMILAFAKNLDGLEEMRFASNGEKREYNGKNYEFHFSQDGRNGTLYAGALLLMIAGAMSSYFSVQLLRADILYANTLQGVEVENINTNDLEKVVKITPYQGWYEVAVSKVYISRLNRLLSTKTDSQESLESIKNESDAVISHAKRAIEISPNNVTFWENYSYVYKRMYELGMERADIFAIRGFEKAISMDPNNPVLRTELGKVYSLQSDKLSDSEKDGKLAQAEEAFNSALTFKMDYPEAMTELALVYLKKDNKDEALRKIDEASTQKGISVSTAIQIAKIYYNLDQKEKAAEILNVVIGLNPKISDAHYILGLIYKDQDRNQEALSEFQTVLELNPGNADVTQKIQELKDIIKSNS